MTEKQIKIEMQVLESSIGWKLLQDKIDSKVAEILKMFINWPLEWADEKKYSKVNILQMQCRLLELVKWLPSEIIKWNITYDQVDLSDRL